MGLQALVIMGLKDKPSMKINRYLIHIGLLIFLVVGFYLIAFKIIREDTLPLLITYSALFLGLWFWTRNYSSLWGVFVLGFVLRFLFWNHLPTLSQDFYRFLWDGAVQLLGINPYRHTPNFLIEHVGFPNAQLFYEKMGSLSNGHFSNYPALSQYFYRFTALFNESELLSTVQVLRSIHLGGEITLFFAAKRLLEYFKLPEEYLSWYFLNPLVIVEGIGNLHGESLMLAFTLLAFLYCLKRKPVFGGFFMALAIGTKLLPLLIVPFFFKYLRLRNFALFTLTVFFFSVALWLPFGNLEVIENYTKTIELWFTTFEFNGSIYKIVRAMGYEVKGYNIIRSLGKVTPFITLGLLVLFTFVPRNRTPKQLASSILLFLSVYFFTSTTVHPWYIINLLFLGILSGYGYPLVWSLTVFWSYHVYGQNTVEEQLVWPLSEYLLVYGFFFYELIKGPLGNHFQKPNFFST